MNNVAEKGIGQIRSGNPFTRLSGAKFTTWLFWGCFFLLNFGLFLPIFLFFQEEATFWPLAKGNGGEGPTLLQTLFLQRENLDLFRLNFELAFLVCLWLWVAPLRHRLFWGAAFILYLLQLSYALYEGFIRSYYLLDPIFYNDLPLFADGGRYALQMMDLPLSYYLGGLLALLLLLGLLYGLHRLLFRIIDPEQVGSGTKIGLAGLTLTAALLLFSSRDAGGLETAVSSFTAKLAQNISLSRAARTEAQRFDNQYLAQFYQFTEKDLAQKPNIYIIFVESYGSVLYQRSDFRLQYEQLLKALEEQLDRQGWQAASTRSLAPTWGGGSWISYTSFLTGLQLDSHAEYLLLFNRYQDEPFPHLFTYLQSQGYRRYRLSSNSDQLNDIEWQRYKNFYGVDQWLRFTDMQYSGPLYGWGPAPPDQYAVHHTHELIKQTAVSPYVFFFISQNSHYPWNPLPDFVEDWRALADEPPLSPQPIRRPPHAELRRQYLASIEYELTSLTDFIVTEGGENDLFILVGDHQPARVARYDDGWDTFVHIIGRDEAFIEAFHEYHFVPGLRTGTVEPAMHHAGFYTLFMRILLQQYGVNQDDLPVFLPDGFR